MKIGTRVVYLMFGGEYEHGVLVEVKDGKPYVRFDGEEGVSPCNPDYVFPEEPEP